jgi:Icc protein
MGSAGLSVAQFSDLHLRADPRASVWGHDPARQLTRVMNAWPAPPDVVVLSGDIADDGSAAAYQRVAAILDGWADHLIVVPGNHDDRAEMAAVFGPVEQTTLASVSDAWAIATIDSVRPGAIGGEAPVDALPGLEADIVASGRSVLAFVHHPVAPPCHYSECGLVGAAALATTVEQSNVALLASGHLHDPFVQRAGPTVMLGAPSTCVALRHGDGELHWTPTDGPVGGIAFELADDGSFRHELVVVASE